MSGWIRPVSRATNRNAILEEDGEGEVIDAGEEIAAAREALASAEKAPDTERRMAHAQE